VGIAGAIAYGTNSGGSSTGTTRVWGEIKT
jgi:hypothetical protein